MAAFSNYLENQLLNHTLRNTAYTAPATLYLALFTSAGSLAELEAGTLTHELTGGSYARQTITFNAAASGSTANSAIVTFSALPAATVNFVAVMDASTAGNVLYFAQMSSSAALTSGDSYQISAGGLTIQLD